MRKHLTRAVLAALALFMTTPAFADGLGDQGPDAAAAPIHAAPVQPANDANAAPVGREGVIPLNNGQLTLNVPSGYKFYSAEEAYAYLQRNNATAPNGTVFGLLAKNGDDIRAPGTWATVVSYDAIGYVQPETAAGLTDANFETNVRSARQTQNRAFEGFIAQPAFDTAAPNLVWAERAAGCPLGAGIFCIAFYPCLLSIGAAAVEEQILRECLDIIFRLYAACAFLVRDGWRANSQPWPVFHAADTRSCSAPL